MLCSRCGTENAVGSQFCTRCWSPMQQSASAGGTQSGRPLDTAPRSSYETVPQIPAPPFGQIGPASQWTHPSTQPYAQPRSAGSRAVVALVLGALSSFMWCPALSIAAILVGRSELKAIEMGQSPREGHTFAKVGYILGVVFTIVHVGAVLLFVLIYGAAIIVWLLAMLAVIASGG
jgi:hypothetical protein